MRANEVALTSALTAAPTFSAYALAFLPSTSKPTTSKPAFLKPKPKPPIPANRSRTSSPIPPTLLE
ncbi:MAG: hypothetical protein QXG35_06700 [Nitrososphaerota archaeon]